MLGLEDFTTDWAVQPTVIAGQPVEVHAGRTPFPIFHIKRDSTEAHGYFACPADILTIQRRYKFLNSSCVHRVVKRFHRIGTSIVPDLFSFFRMLQDMLKHSCH